MMAAALAAATLLLHAVATVVQGTRQLCPKAQPATAEGLLVLLAHDKSLGEKQKNSTRAHAGNLSGVSHTLEPFTIYFGTAGSC